MTIQGSGITSNNGLPQLKVFDANLASVTQLTAISVSQDGTTATFPYPTNSNGTALTIGHYSYVLANQTAPGVYSDKTGNFFSIGSASSTTTPYGVDAADITVTSVSCGSDGIEITCSSGSQNSYVAPVYTSSSTGLVTNLDGKDIQVESWPTAIKIYGAAQQVIPLDPYGGYQETDEPANAIVTNFGSNTVSILSLVNDVVTNTISVGTEPAAVVVNSNWTKAYVANYGSASISIIDLTSNALSGSIAVGPSPAALTMDPGGTALWVGGLNYISKIDLTSLATLTSLPSISGQVTSVAVSSGQNAIAYTTISTDLTTFQTAQASLVTNSASIGTAQINASGLGTKIYTSQSVANTAYANGNGNGVPPGFLLSNGALVSAQYGNRYCVLGTPTGFNIIDMQGLTTIFTGTTSGPIRGIATDSQYGSIFLASPDSDQLISVPYPPLS